MNSEIKKILNDQGFLYSDIKGTSMNPMLYENRDRIILKKKENRLKKGDIALYERPCGSLILHRVNRVYKDSYTFCGDNQILLEKGVKDENVLAVATSYYKKGKLIDLNKSFKYKLYLFFYGKNLIVRRIRLFFKKVKNKLFKKGNKI